MSQRPVDCIYASVMIERKLWITAIDFGIEQTYYHCLMKRCPRCGGTKPYWEFHRNRVRRDGLQSICIKCRAFVAMTSTSAIAAQGDPVGLGIMVAKLGCYVSRRANRARTAQRSFPHRSCSGITCLAIRSWETSALSEVGLDKKFLRRSQNVSWCVRIATPCAHSRGRVGPHRGLNATGNWRCSVR